MYELFQWIWEHRNQPLTLATVISFAWLLADKFGRKLITNQLKRLFHVRDKSEFSTYVANQNRIESKVDMLLEERGLTWDVHYLNTPKLSNGTTSQKKSLLSWLMAQFRARTIGASIWLTGSLYHFKTEREYIQMKNKLLSRKFLMAVISAILVIANDGLNLGLDSNTIIAFGSIVVGYIAVQGAVDAKNTPKAGVTPYDAKSLDSVRQDSEDAKFTASN